jgi:hypothetical protein
MKRTGSAKKSSSSRKRSPSAKRVTARKRTSAASAREFSATGQFAICVRNDEYEASLELRKLYPVLEDDFGAQHGMIRVIDESGEDYLFPTEWFVRISLPHALEKRLQKIA